MQEPKSTSAFDLISIAVCALIWGTTFFAITLQLGVVDPLVSVVYRFTLAAALLFVWCKISGDKIQLTRRQHFAAIGVGVFTFSINYPMVYVAEQHVTSAVVAVVFAAMAFVNLVLFRIIFRQRARVLAWIGALLGVMGVGLISWDEVVVAHMNAETSFGIGLTCFSILMASLGNVSARVGEQEGAPVTSVTAWSMAYGAAVLAIFVQVSGRAWRFEPTPMYVGSLLYLAFAGSVVAFLLYFGLARRRGYGTAAYISAIAPLVAMVVSGVMEHRSWGIAAFAAAAFVLAGQILMLRSKRA